jgi:hypothetical protein
MTFPTRLTLAVLLTLSAAFAQAAAMVEDIRIWFEDGRTRLVLDLDRPVEHNIFTLRGPLAQR